MFGVEDNMVEDKRILMLHYKKLRRTTYLLHFLDRLGLMNLLSILNYNLYNKINHFGRVNLLYDYLISKEVKIKHYIDTWNIDNNGG